MDLLRHHILATEYYRTIFINEAHADVIDIFGIMPSGAPDAEEQDVYIAKTYPSLNLSLTDIWKNPTIIAGTNCMAFALNRYDFGTAHPDIFAPEIRNRLSTNDPLEYIEEIRIAMKVSNFQRVRLNEIDRRKNHIVAVVCSSPPGEEGEFDFYRLDTDGWYHKLAASIITNEDTNGNRIITPEECARNEGKKFLGYYVLPKTGVDILLAKYQY